MTESDQQVKNEDVPDKREQWMQSFERPIPGGGNRNGRNQRQCGCDRALLRSPGIEAMFKQPGIADKCALHAAAPAKRPPLLQRQRGHDGEEIHSFRSSMASSMDQASIGMIDASTVSSWINSSTRRDP